MNGYSHRMVLASMATVLWSLAGRAAGVQEQPKEEPEFPPFAEVSKGFEKVVSTADGQASLYTVWVREKDGQMLAELPKNFPGQKHFIAMTMPTGEMFAGLQTGAQYVY